MTWTRVAAGALLVFVLQAVVIFWLGERDPVGQRPRPAVSGFIGLPPERVHELAAENPAALAFPGMDGFSGEAWMPAPEPQMRGYEWTEEPRWLPIDTRHLAGTFAALLSGQVPTIDPVQARPAPDLAFPVIARDLLFSAQSSVVAGLGLEGRKLESFPNELPSWASADILTNSVVQVAVDPEGRVISAILLRSSNLPAADQFALQRSLQARFSPAFPSLQETPPIFEFGQLVFEWRTVPPPVPAATKP